MALTSSGSSFSAFPVKPTRSAKSAVTTLRSSRASPAPSPRRLAQDPQNRKPSGFSAPQRPHVITARGYFATAVRAPWPSGLDVGGIEILLRWALDDRAVVGVPRA